MFSILAGSAVISVFHALIPSHWLPILAISRKESWPPAQVLWVTFVAGLAHVLSTVLVGVLLAAFGLVLSDKMAFFTTWVSPALLIALGFFYIYQHYFHHHFHLQKQASRFGIIASLSIAMFLSPCFEIEGYFLAAGPHGWHFVALLALLYALLTISGMLIWMRLALHGLKKLDWHALEHHAGLIAGVTLIISGLLINL